ncbi:MAG: hypothetical protein Q4G23_08800 [Clostridia bacterium]|nr:hypothetical protein [Clostridia bacterium]
MKRILSLVLILITVSALVMPAYANEVEEGYVTLYAQDGRTIEVKESEVPAYLNVGWYTEPYENRVTLYASDGRTIEVKESEVPAYLNVGWYTEPYENRVTLYASDGRTIEVKESEVPAYLNVGWYASYHDAIEANKPQYEEPTYSSGTVYVTPTGKRYHLSPTCGGKNSKASTLDAALQRGLTPCKKCA